MTEKLTDIGKSLGADPATVKLCAALIEFRSYNVNSPIAEELRKAAQSLSALLLEVQNP